MAEKTKNKVDIKRAIPLRSAGEKVSASEERPSARLFAEVKRLEAEEEKLRTVSPTTPYHPLPPRTTNDKSQALPVSPKRDFTKFANSLVRDAIPSGLFKGTSKNTYDVLYQKTRGAIEPVRRIKAVQSDVLRWTNVSHNTLRAHLKHLEGVGLVKIHYKLGDNSGAEYEILLPEEVIISIENADTFYPPLPPPTTTQKLVPPSTQNLLVGGGGLTPANIEESVTLKTSLKTNTEDDDVRAREAFSPMIKKLDDAVKKLTGKSSSKYEADKWEMLANLLILELEVAAKHTSLVSSVPAFLTEILRRQFFASRRQQDSAKPSKRKIDTVGKSDFGSYEIKPLEEKVREAAVEQLREFAADDFLEDFEKWYTPDDWAWLMKELEKA